MKNNFDPKNLEYSHRENYSIKNKTVKEALPEVFAKVMEHLQPQFEKMRDEKDFKAVHAFGHYNTGFNKFCLDIFGEALPDQTQLMQNPLAPPQDSEHFIENMKMINDQLLKVVFDEMLKQNITGGAGSAIMAHSNVGVIDFFYCFAICWRCYPNGTDESDFIQDRNEMRRKAFLN
jgi:hypothetical protein